MAGFERRTCDGRRDSLPAERQPPPQARVVLARSSYRLDQHLRNRSRHSMGIKFRAKGF